LEYLATVSRRETVMKGGYEEREKRSNMGKLRNLINWELRK
jgi:hypothetical protein